jgi:putative restriction endonuclease
MTFDRQIRLEAFHWLSQQVAVHGDVLPRQILAKGFDHDNVRVPLIGPQGIFKPRIIPEIPLSITTAPRGPYDDGFEERGVLHYKYRGTDSSHRDNVGLRKAMTTKTPLAYFFGIVPGKYMAA